MTTRIVMHADDQFFEQSKYGAIWGTIYFQIDQKFFPGEGWTDLVVGFLRVWLESLLGIENGDLVEDEIPFFDGPFKIHVSTERPKTVRLTFIHNDKAQFSITEVTQHLLDDAAHVSQRLVNECSQRGWNNADTTALSLLIGKYLRSLPN